MEALLRKRKGTIINYARTIGLNKRLNRIVPGRSRKHGYSRILPPDKTFFQFWEIISAVLYMPEHAVSHLLLGTLQAHLVLLRFALRHFTDSACFYRLKVYGSPVSSKSISAIFPTACAHFASLCHILVILTIFQTFSLLSYMFWWSVISDLWCYYDSLKAQMMVNIF